MCVHRKHMRQNGENEERTKDNRKKIEKKICEYKQMNDNETWKIEIEREEFIGREREKERAIKRERGS